VRINLLDRARILEMPDLIVVDVPIPEWPNADGTPGVIRLRQLSAEAAFQLAWEVQHGRAEDGMFLLIALSAVDEHGALLFSERDIARLKQKNVHALDRLQRVCLALNAGAYADAARVPSGEASGTMLPT
jgi:hypothetical protein